MNHDCVLDLDPAECSYRAACRYWDPVSEKCEYRAIKHFSLAEDLLMLELAMTAETRLVIIDPISAYLGDNVDSHVNTSVRAVLAPLAALAARTAAAVLGVSHLNKGQGAAVYRVQGSIAFTAAARAVWAVGKDPQDETGHRRLLLPVKCNLAADMGGLSYELEDADGHATVHWGDAVSRDATEALVYEHPAVVSEQQQAQVILTELLTSGSQPAKEVYRIAAESGISKTTLWRVSRQLKIRKERSGYQGAVIWSLPDSLIDSKQVIDSIDSYPGKYGIYEDCGMYEETEQLPITFTEEEKV